jgi:hypothetical protein
MKNSECEAVNCIELTHATLRLRSDELRNSLVMQQRVEKRRHF